MTPEKIFTHNYPKIKEIGPEVNAEKTKCILMSRAEKV
jgi:hypothetical protein